MNRAPLFLTLMLLAWLGVACGGTAPAGNQTPTSAPLPEAAATHTPLPAPSATPPARGAETPQPAPTPTLQEQGGGVPEPTATAVSVIPPSGVTDLSQLPIVIPGYVRQDPDGSYPFIDYFNEFARDTDYIQFLENALLRDKPGQLAAMRRVQRGIIIQSFASVKTAREELQKDVAEGSPLLSLIDCINYDLEHWDKSFGEWEDVAGSSQQMAALAQQYGLCYIGGVTGRLDEEQPATATTFGSTENMAIPVDMYNAHWFGYPARFGIPAYAQYLQGIVVRVKKANPNARIVLSISVEKDELSDDQLYQFFEQVADSNDVIGIFSLNKPDSLARLKALVARIRGQ